jgi:hypothetical protein
MLLTLAITDAVSFEAVDSSKTTEFDKIEQEVTSSLTSE